MIANDLASIPKTSVAEYAAAQFLLGNPDFVMGHSAKEIALEANVSAATITRLCRRVGMDSFNEFKLRYVTEWTSSSGNLYARLSTPLISESQGEKDGESFSSLVHRFYGRMLYEQARIIEQGALDHLCEILKISTHIDLYGTGINQGIVEQAAFKLQTLGCNAQALTAINMQSVLRQEKDSRRSAIITSHTGANPSMVETATALRRNGVFVASLAPDTSSELGKASDICIRTFRTTTPDRLSLLAYPIAVQYVFDVIYTTLLSSEIKDMYPKTAREYYAR